MSESETPPATIYAQPWAVRLGGVLLAAFALILIAVFHDNAHRAELETVSETTAVGDKRFLELPDTLVLPAVVAMLDGKPLYLAAAKRLDLRDTHTQRVGRDTQGGLWVYKLSAAALEPERRKTGGDAQALLLKTGVNEFVVVRPGR